MKKGIQNIEEGMGQIQSCIAGEFDKMKQLLAGNNRRISIPSLSDLSLLGETSFTQMLQGTAVIEPTSTQTSVALTH